MIKKKCNDSKLNKVIFFILLSLFCYQSQSNAISKDQKIKVNTKTFDIINRYYISSSNYKKNFKNSFKSKSLSRIISQYEIMNISLSQTGDVVVLSFCDHDFSGCAQDYLAKFQTLKKCERLSKTECRNIIQGKQIVLNNKKIFLDTNEDLGKYFLINDKEKIESRAIHYEIQYPSHSQFADNDYDN